MKRDQLLEQLKIQGISDAKVLKAFASVDRKDFVSEKFLHQAYVNEPLPIGEGQTISQPFIVAFAAQMLQVQSDDRILEIGSGSGYQAAVLAQLAKDVYGVEINAVLARESQERILKLKYKNIHLRRGDGAKGWESEAPFDKILISAAASSVPPILLEQLKLGGLLLAPVGQRRQNLMLLTKTRTGFKEKSLLPVLFVPLTGSHGDQPQLV